MKVHNSTHGVQVGRVLSCYDVDALCVFASNKLFSHSLK